MTPDQTLWHTFLSGDHTAFRQLYDRYYSSLSQYASRLCADEQMVSECIQDLFIKLWTHRANLSVPLQTKAYLMRAIRNIVYNKRTLKQQLVYCGSADELDVFRHEHTPDIVFSADTPLSPELSRLLTTLTDRQLEAIYLYYVEDFSYQEIGQFLQIRTEAVYKLVYRALAALRTEKKAIAR